MNRIIPTRTGSIIKAAGKYREKNKTNGPENMLFVFMPSAGNSSWQRIQYQEYYREINVAALEQDIFVPFMITVL